MTRAQDIKYMKILRSNLRIIFAWPLKELGEAQGKLEMLGRIYILTLSFNCAPPNILFIRKNVGTMTFFDLGQTYIVLLMNIVAFVSTVYSLLDFDLIHVELAIYF